jgi:hypothetical protein
MKRWQDIIDRLKEEGDCEAAAALWDARQAATLTASEQVAIKWAAEMLEAGSLPRTLHQDSAATLRGLLERMA